jgi:hypothetical protein
VGVVCIGLWKVKCGLPENFDSELFKAVDDLVRAREKKSDTDPDSDPEAELEVVDVAAELGMVYLQDQEWCFPIKSLQCM